MYTEIGYVYEKKTAASWIEDYKAKFGNRSRSNQKGDSEAAV